MPSAIVFLVAGFVVLVLGADWLVRGASRLATAVGISPLVVGLTVVAFGTSAPELAVSVMSAFNGQADIALGNVVGSNICNVLLILGISAIIIPLTVHRQLVRLDIPVMVGASLLMWAMALDGSIGRLDGMVLALLVVGYTIYLIRRSRREETAVREEYEKEYGAPTDEKPSAAMIFKMLGLIVAGIVGLVLGSKWLVDSATFIALEFGISELIIGLTIIAFGTSLPEVATSIMAALKGERDIAVGNIVGSNTFNILTVLGIASVVSPAGISVPAEALRFDIPFMVMIALVCWPMLADGLKVSRINGIFLISFYGAYLAYLFFLSTNRLFCREPFGGIDAIAVARGFHQFQQSHEILHHIRLADDMAAHVSADVAAVRMHGCEFANDARCGVGQVSFGERDDQVCRCPRAIDIHAVEADAAGGFLFAVPFAQPFGECYGFFVGPQPFRPPLLGGECFAGGGRRAGQVFHVAVQLV